MKVPLFAPVRSNEALLPEIEARIAAFLRAGDYILGQAVTTFEQNLARRLDYRHAVGCSSGTDALILALKAVGVEPGDEVITPAFSFVASSNAIAWIGARPVFADVDLHTGCVTVETVQKVLTPRTKVIMAVDLYGRQAPIAELKRLCQRQGIVLIEDGAQSIGVPNRAADIYTTSFYPTKNLGAVGDAGAVLTNDAAIAAAVHEASRHGGASRDHYTRIGTNGRMDTLQAEILNLKLPLLDQWTASRRAMAKHYLNALAPLHDSEKLVLPAMPDDPTDHIWALFTIRVPRDRGAILEALKQRGVGAAVYYPKALPDQPSLAPFATTECPAARQLASEVISLPIYPELTGKELEFVVKQVVECWLPKENSTSSCTSR